MSDVSTAFFALPDALKESAKAIACKRYGVEDFFDLDPAVRQEVYLSATA
jgi:hypothetical protein